MPLLIVSGLIQLGLIVHALKTGRSQYWVMIIFSIPIFGAAAYLIVEVIPELLNAPGNRRKVNHVLNPNRNLKEAERDAQVANTFETRTRLAGEQFEKRQYKLAENNYKEALKGMYEFEPYAMAGLANVLFSQQKYSDAKSTLDTLKEKNPDFRNQDAHLLYARCLDALKDTEGAKHEYESLIQYFTGPEPSVHYANLLAATGDNQQAKKLLQDVLHNAKISAKHYTKLHKQWIQLAQQRLRELELK